MLHKPHPVVREVARFFGRHSFLRGERLLIALSGGADSVALLHALVELRECFDYELHLAHLNHGLRDTEAARDEAFVRELGATLGLPLEIGHETQLRGRNNLEERARAARYAFLAAAARRAGAGRIALAHHAGDQAETVLLRLIRGSGATGLGAMAEVGPGALIRPLLNVEPGQIRAYLAAVGARHIEDSSNASLAHDRNRIRHLVMPLLEREFVPGLTRRLGALAAELRLTDDLVNGLAREFLLTAVDESGALAVERLGALHSGLINAVLRGFVNARTGSLLGYHRRHIEALRRLCLDSGPSAQIDLPRGWRARRQYGKLKVEKAPCTGRDSGGYELALGIGEATWVAEAGLTFQCAVLAKDTVTWPASQQEALFDASAIAPGLKVRNFRPGDRIVPLGLKGSRKVKDIFIGRRIPRALRSRMPIVTLGEQIVWLPGLVRSNIAVVGAQTTEVVRVRAVGIAPNLNCVLASK
jgi:tRNA(Ile)-lysidine synthase